MEVRGWRQDARIKSVRPLSRDHPEAVILSVLRCLGPALLFGAGTGLWRSGRPLLPDLRYQSHERLSGLHVGRCRRIRKAIEPRFPASVRVGSLGTGESAALR